MEQYLFDDLPQGPFAKLRKLIEGVTPAQSIFDMSIGEPKHQFPNFVEKILNENMSDFGKYPPALGSEALRSATANWLNRRFDLNNKACKDSHITVLNGTREGLFNAALLTVKTSIKTKPIVAMPDPFYQVYAAGAMASQADILFLPTPAKTGYMPDLNAISDAQWANMQVFYICSPANPQGAFANKAYYTQLLKLAKKHDFYIFSDECYSEIYSDEAPISALEVALEYSNNNNDFEKVVSFFSLSKRSSLPGLRSGFCAGDSGFIKRFKNMRNIAAPQVPLPLQAVSAAVWNDEAHVVVNRNLYNQKLDAADELLGGMFNYYRPKGGFFLWLDMSEYGGGVEAAKQLWVHCGIKALPGGYLSSLADEDDENSIYGDANNETASKYLRLALVGNLDDTKQALNRMVNHFKAMGARL